MTKPKERMVPANVTITAAQANALDKMRTARADGSTISSLVREAIAYWLSREDN